MTASRTGKVDAVTALLKQGANPNAKERSHDQTALMWAASDGHTAIENTPFYLVRQLRRGAGGKCSTIPT